MRTKVLAIVVAFCLLLITGCQEQEKTAVEEIQDRGVLKVGTAGDYQPMSYLDPETGDYVGFEQQAVRGWVGGWKVLKSLSI